MVSLVGIVNCTPDSFSDGEEDFSNETLYQTADRLLIDGADILDIGGDSTRPGSVCVGPEEEWRRIAPVVEEFAPRGPCSIDTHHCETAKRALERGATFINDISGTLNPEMVDAICRYNAKYIVMFNPHKSPHRFGAGLCVSNAVATIQSWISATSRTLQESGLEPSQIIFDPGMGAFLSDDPSVSWSVIEHIGSLVPTAGGLLVGCSRKGFLRRTGEIHPSERDRLSALCGALIARQIEATTPLYLRVHNVALQKKALTENIGALSVAHLRP